MYSQDRGLDPINRIMGEPALVHTSQFRVLNDAAPISKSHLLVVSEYERPCFLDDGGMHEISGFLRSARAIDPSRGDWFFVERGRASFCTSGMTTSYAHGHLFKTYDFVPGVERKLAEVVLAESYPSLHEGVKRLAVFPGEYILIASSCGCSFVRSFEGTSKPGKRLIRNTLHSLLRSP